MICAEAFLDDYNGINLTLEVKSFSSDLSLRQRRVHGLAIGSLDLRLVSTIGIAERDGEIAYK
jgi:hypothetical protein